MIAVASEFLSDGALHVTSPAGVLEHCSTAQEWENYGVPTGLGWCEHSIEANPADPIHVRTSWP